MYWRRLGLFERARILLDYGEQFEDRGGVSGGRGAGGQWKTNSNKTRSVLWGEGRGDEWWTTEDGEEGGQRVGTQRRRRVWGNHNMELLRREGGATGCEAVQLKRKRALTEHVDAFLRHGKVSLHNVFDPLEPQPSDGGQSSYRRPVRCGTETRIPPHTHTDRHRTPSSSHCSLARPFSLLVRCRREFAALWWGKPSSKSLMPFTSLVEEHGKGEGAEVKVGREEYGAMMQIQGGSVATGDRTQKNQEEEEGRGSGAPAQCLPFPASPQDSLSQTHTGTGTPEA